MSELRRGNRRRVVLLIVCAMLALTGGAAFSQRTTLTCWYYGYRLERAAETERQAWADRLVSMGEPSVPRLLACLRKDDAKLCAIARTSLEKMIAEREPKDPRSVKIADRFFEAHPTFSPAGQLAALQMLPELLTSGGAEAASKARTFVSAALKDRSAEHRIEGIKIARRIDLNLLPAVVPMLNDPEADVRLAAMVALGPISEGGGDSVLVSSEELLHWLHDPDADVRQMCEMSLRSRNLRDRDIRLGRMLTNPDPKDRLKLLLELPDDEDANLSVWLQRLSNDPDSAVRAGAARVAAERRVDFIERLDQMMTTDPDGTVRKIAEHYRKWYR
ncbi:MAG: HEAT repeat domain-containing protein [Planctomycetes bacterium]|nr:HEAT repeat domain-containing protein [Planctomycetota bacterium]